MSGSGAGVGWVILGNSAIGAGTYTATQYLNGDKFSWNDFAFNGGVGAVFGYIGGSEASNIQKLTRLQTAGRLSKFLGLQSGQQINRQLFFEVSLSISGTSFLQGVRDELIQGVGSSVFGIGSSGEHVQYLQAVLGVEQDGIFGNQTKAALQTLQTKLGVNPDGIYGSQTREALKKLFY